MPRSLITVADKRGVAYFARALQSEFRHEIVSTGGTAKLLREHGITVIDAADETGFPEMLDGRVKTLHPAIHAGILARMDQLEELAAHTIAKIDLVCVDLYPLALEINRPGSTEASILEQVDVGGIALLGAAAKARRIVIADPDDYERVLAWLRVDQPNRDDFLRELAAKADFVAAKYRLLSAQHFSNGAYAALFGERVAELAYGENPWQKPAYLYRTPDADTNKLAIPNFELVLGQPSFNIIHILQAGLQIITCAAAGYLINGARSAPKIAVGLKHGHSSGVAVLHDGYPAQILTAMLEGSLLAIHGCTIVVNFPIGEAEADLLLRYRMQGARRLIDSIAAPSFTAEAVTMLQRIKEKCRFLANPALGALSVDSMGRTIRVSPVEGGFTTQPNPTYFPDFKDPEIEIIGPHQHLANDEANKLVLALAVCARSISNTVTIVQGNSDCSWLIGNGAGQTARVFAAELAVWLARRNGHGAELKNAVAASDSFFVETDALEALVDAGVSTVFATSGSRSDDKIREYARKAGVTLCLLPDVKARQFFGHQFA